MPYFVTPRRYKLIATRSTPQLRDRAGLVTIMTNGPSGSATTVFYSRAAYMGFVGAGMNVELNDMMWGLHEPWRMEVPADKRTVYFDAVAANYRTSGERALRELLLKAANIAAAIAGAAAVPAKLVQWAQELGITEAVLRAAAGTSVGGIVDKVVDWMGEAVLGPPNCDGEIYRSSLSISTGELDTYLADQDRSPTSVIEDGGTTMVTRVLYTLKNANPIVPGGGCNSPVGELVLEFERRMPLLFDHEALEERAVITGAPHVRSRHVIGHWVDEASFAGPLYHVQIDISMRDAESDYLTVHVVESTIDVHGAHVFFEHTFENVELKARNLPPPKGANILGSPGDPGGPFPHVDFGEAKMKTSVLTLASGDIGNAEIRIWSTSARHRQQEILTGFQLHYRRNGLAHAKRTSTWLAKRGGVL